MGLLNLIFGNGNIRNPPEVLTAIESIPRSKSTSEILQPLLTAIESTPRSESTSEISQQLQTTGRYDSPITRKEYISPDGTKTVLYHSYSIKIS